jgi:hypothetical protein
MIWNHKESTESVTVDVHNFFSHDAHCVEVLQMNSLSDLNAFHKHIKTNWCPHTIKDA